MTATLGSPDESQSPATPGTLPTARFRRQHEELTALAKVILRELDTRRIAENSAPVRHAIAAFTGKLRIHAAMEDEALYPALLASSDEAVSSKARELREGIGGLYTAYFAYTQSWKDPQRVAGDVEAFCRETMGQLRVLGMRMKQEDRQLYPLCDALELSAGHASRVPPDH